MSAASDLRAALLAHTPLTDLVGQRVRQDFGDESDDYPFVIFKQTGNNPIRGLDGSLHVRQEDFQVESWGVTRAASAAIHVIVEAALLAADIECDPAEPDAIDPEIGSRACVWNVRIWSST
ncbi:MAG: hypothetical protein RJA36_3933 [Pseudomonadota bacterium]|jgi:hypothetical protein